MQIRWRAALVSTVALIAGSMALGGSPRAVEVHAATPSTCPAGYVCAYTGKGETGQVYKVYVGDHLMPGKCYDIETGQFIDSVDNETNGTVVLKEGNYAHPGAAHPGQHSREGQDG